MKYLYMACITILTLSVMLRDSQSSSFQHNSPLSCGMRITMVHGLFTGFNYLFFVTLLPLHRTICGTVRTTSNVTNLGLVQKEAKLPNSTELRLTTNGLMICACSCILTDFCASFNFRKTDGQCEIN